MNLNVRIAAAAYAVPPDEENVAEILERLSLAVARSRHVERRSLSPPPLPSLVRAR